MSAGLKKGFLTGAIAVLLGATLVQTVGTTSAGAVNFDPCRRWTFYLVTSVPSTWEEAAAIARRMGGKLAVIQSAAENACANAVQLAGGGSGGVWIGGSDTVEEGVWRWDGGTSRDGRVVFTRMGAVPRAAYANWEPGEPSGGAENCAMMYWNGRWNDAHCPNTYYFLVEY